MATPAGQRSWHASPAVWPVLGIVSLVLLNALFDKLLPGGPGLFGPGAFLRLSMRDGVPAGALVDILNYGGAIAILALGMTPVIATRGVDLSVGSVMALAGAVAASLVVADVPSIAALATALAVGAACGLCNGVLVSFGGVQPFVVTLVLMVAGRGVAQLVTGSQITTFHDPLLEFVGLGRPAWLPLPMPFILATAMLGATVLALRRTALGLFTEAVGSNPEAAALVGVRSRLLVAAAYVFCGLCAALAGLIAMANIKGADPFNAGRNAELAAIFAVVVGGTSLAGGRMCLLGAFAGAFLLQALTTTMYARNIGADVAPLPQALAILAVCIVGSPPVAAMLGRRRKRTP
ncbi:MAG: ABC transporter permease [Phycisphaerales bacterium]|nr:ABC transporter permease [Phycisphaerales bacterium]